MARSKSTSGSKTGRTNTEASINRESASIASPEPNVKAAAAGATAAEAASESRVVAEPRRLEVVKPEGRKNIVPINLEEEIRRRAYELYQQRGSSPGNEAEDWLTAEREVLHRYHQQQSA